MASYTNGDGFNSREELPHQIQRRFDQMDANGDGSVDENEIDEILRYLHLQPVGRVGQGRPRGPGKQI